VENRKIDLLKAYIQSKGWTYGPSTPIQYGEQITINYGSHHAIVNYYPKRGKIVVGGPDSPLKEALNDWIDSVDQTQAPAYKAGQYQFADTTKVSESDGKLKQRSSIQATPVLLASPHIGMDESGKGDWFGPLVVAAVFVNEGIRKTLQEIGVRDSKLLKAPIIKQLASQIEDIIPPDQRYILVIEPQLYNKIYDQYKNINLLLADAYSQVAQEIRHTTQCDIIVCDQFAQNADRLEIAFAAKHLPNPIQQHHAESASIAVAAASILASAAFSAALQELASIAGMNTPLPKGATDIRNLEAVVYYIENLFGREELAQYAKLNFKPIQNLFSDNNKIVTETPTFLPREGQQLTIQRLSWSVQEYPGGFWRFAFTDGGLLDWHAYSNGKLDVRGTSTSRSYLKLKEMAHGKIFKPGKTDEEMRQKLERLKSRVQEVFSDEQVQISAVQGVGWQHRDTVLGTRFSFTDGGILQHYHGKGTLLVQGKPSEPTKKALAALVSLRWQGPDELADFLKILFPDWQSGKTISSSEDIHSAASTDTWQAGENSLNWNVFWPPQRDIRHAANGKSPCQRALLEDWASVASHNQGKKHLLAHAPTGLGKTMSSLVPALAWVALAPDKRRIYYLVNRTAQHDNPIREMKSSLASIFAKQTGQLLQVIDMVGRHQLCRHPDSRDLTDLCKRSRDRADFSQLPSPVSSWQEVQTHINSWNCPYHTLQGLMARAHVIICDYWWLFSQIAQERGLTERVGFSPLESIVIVDEAHNLPLRVREELSVNEVAEDIEEALRQTPLYVQVPLKAVVDEILTSDPAIGVPPSVLAKHFGGTSALQSTLDKLTAGIEPAASLSSVPERILRLLLQPDQAVIAYSSQDVEGRQRLIFGLVDPKPILREGYSRVYASLSMSGTLAAPSDDSNELCYQVPLFGLPQRDTLTRKYASPFPLRNQRWIYCPDTRGTYKEREQYLTKYADHIIAIGNKTPGVTAVFFNSYNFLEKVQASIRDTSELELVVVENRSRPSDDDTSASSPGEYEQRLKLLVNEHGRAYLFAIYQGKLAEGADFGGNLIKTVVCLSIPLEYPALYHKSLQVIYKQDFAAIATERGDDSEKKAKEYSLDRLSLSLVLQACGRGIRGEADRCAFVLLDERYERYDWRRFLNPRPYNLSRPEQTVEAFHKDSTSVDQGEWDKALLAVCRIGDV
jgi:ribonuclease HIII